MNAPRTILVQMLASVQRTTEEPTVLYADMERRRPWPFLSEDEKAVVRADHIRRVLQQEALARRVMTVLQHQGNG